MAETLGEAPVGLAKSMGRPELLVERREPIDAWSSRAPLLRRPGRPVERQKVEVDGGAIAFADIGEGDVAIVPIHGVLTTLDDMVLALSDHLPGCRIIAFDRPGFGQSSRRTSGDAGVLRQAERLNAALDALRIDTAVLVGHSFGAPVALAMAMAAPARSLGVVSLAPLVTPELRLEHMLFGARGIPVLGGWISGWSHAGLDEKLLPLLWRAMYLPQTMPQVVETEFPFALAGEAGAITRAGEDCLAAGADLLTLLARAATFEPPLHVLGGSADLVVNNLLHGRALAAVAPQGRFTLLPGIGHMLHHVAPDVVSKAIRELLAA